MAGLSQAASDNLDKQGFCDLGEEGKSHYVRTLRFTPAVATTLVVIGLILQSPLLLASMALVALTGVLFPRGMVIDLAFNLAIRHVFGSPKLPPTPPPRRFSYGISTVWLTVSAASFHFGVPLVGFLFGVPVAVGGAILATTLWCLGSWLYRPVETLVAGFKDKRRTGT